jgi:hypothetical protein
LFDENCRVYQYLFKRNNQVIPYQLYANPVVDAAIQNCIAYLQSKSGTLFALSMWYVMLYRRSQTSERLEAALSGFLEHPAKSFLEVCAQSFSTKKTVLVLGKDLDQAQAAILQTARNFILRVSDFLPARILGKQGAFAVLKRALNFDPENTARKLSISVAPLRFQRLHGIEKREIEFLGGVVLGISSGDRSHSASGHLPSRFSLSWAARQQEWKAATCPTFLPLLCTGSAQNVREGSPATHRARITIRR